jgi:hypothetical protein
MGLNLRRERPVEPTKQSQRQRIEDEGEQQIAVFPDQDAALSRGDHNDVEQQPTPSRWPARKLPSDVRIRLMLLALQSSRRQCK